MAKKAKARVLIVRLMSSAGTGFFYTKQRPRTSPKLSMMKYDPKGEYRYIFIYIFFAFIQISPKLKYRPPIVQQHVLFNETKKK